jgi:hypothetical protein
VKENREQKMTQIVGHPVFFDYSAQDEPNTVHWLQQSLQLGEILSHSENFYGLQSVSEIITFSKQTVIPFRGGSLIILEEYTRVVKGQDPEDPLDEFIDMHKSENGWCKILNNANSRINDITKRPTLYEGLEKAQQIHQVYR